MSRADRQAAVAEIVDSFGDATGAVLTEYRGLSVKDLQALRRTLGENASYAVVKNTLAKLAATQAGIQGFDDLLTGPTAIAFINGDVVEAAKGLRDFARTNPALVIKGGVLDGKPLDAAEIAKLADLESREVLLGKMAGAMLASLSQAVYLLNAPLAQVARLAGALQAKAEEDPSVLAGGAGSPAETSGEAPAVIPAETTAETTDAAPAETTDAAPADTADAAPVETPAETAEAAPAETADAAPDEAPAETAAETPAETTAATTVEAPADSTSDTPEASTDTSDEA